MRVTSVKATLLKERVFWARPIEKLVTIAGQTGGRRRRPGAAVPSPGSVLVEIETDEGLVGVGLGGGGRPGAIIVDTFLAPLLLDENPLDIERHWEQMYRATFRYGQAGIVLMAMSGIDMALWDIKARWMGQPVWQLLGGKARDSVPVYATIRDGSWAKEQGFWGVKLGGPYGPLDGPDGMRRNERFVAELRERMGPDMEIMLDCARTWDVPYTLKMARALAPYHLAFIEEPISSHEVDGYARLRRSIHSTLIACGEHVYTRYATRAMLEKGGVDIIQPDIRWTGGLSELVKIYDLATAYGIPVMPHRGAMAWSLHLIMARPNCPVAEGLSLTQEEAFYSVFDGEPVPVKGSLTVSDSPGFGLTLKRDAIGNHLSDT